MRVALREQDHDVARDQVHRRLVADLDVALAFGDQVEDHDALGAGLEHGAARIRARRLIAPGRGEAGLDEDRADQAHDAQGFATAHPSLSAGVDVDAQRRPASALCTAVGDGRAATASSTSARNRSGATPGAAIRTEQSRRAAPAHTGCAVGIGHAEQAARVGAAARKDFERGELDALGRGAHRDAGGRARRPGRRETASPA